MSNVRKNSKELIKNSLIILLGKGSTQFIVFLLLPLYTSILSTTEYGTMDLITTYVTLLAPLISLQLENAIFRYLIDNRNDEKHKREYISSGINCLFLLVIVGFIFINTVSYIFEINYGIYLSLLVMATMFSNYFLSITRGLGKNIEYAKGSIITGITSVSLNVMLLLFFHMGIIGVFISQIISNIICSLYCIIKIRLLNYVKFKYCKKNLTFIQLKYSLPLVPNSVNWWIINASDKTLVSMFLGTSFNGIYSVSNKFSAAFIAVYNIFNLSWAESASLHINDEDRDEFFSKTFNSMYKLFFCLALLLISFLPFVFKMLVDDVYVESYNYIPFLVFGSILNVIVGLLSGIYIAKKLTSEVALTSLFAAIINIITNFLFIKKIKIWAAVFSTIIGFGTMTCYRFIDIRKYIDLRIDYKFLVFSIILYCLVTYMYMKNVLILNIFNLILCIIITLIVNKNVVILLKETILNKTKNKA